MRRVLVVALVVTACTGPRGLQGPAGPPGSGLQTETVCTGFADVGTGYGYDIQGARYTFGDGSVLATCSVDSGNTQASNLAMYKAGQDGGVEGACSVHVNFNSTAGGGGTWAFAMSGHSLTVVYSVSPGTPWTFPCTDT